MKKMKIARLCEQLDAPFAEMDSMDDLKLERYIEHLNAPFSSGRRLRDVVEDFPIPQRRSRSPGRWIA